jgi:hypothetical protein
VSELGSGLVEAESVEESRRLLEEAQPRRRRGDEPEERFRLELVDHEALPRLWVVMFQRPSWDPHKNRMRTTIDGHKGWLDLTLFRMPGPAGEPPVMVFAELKVEPNTPTAEQWAYIRLMRGAGHRHVYLWTPRTMEAIRAFLRTPPGQPFPPTPPEWLKEPGPRVPFPPPSWLEVWGRPRRRLRR